MSTELLSRGDQASTVRAVAFAPPATSAFASEVKREVAKYFADRGISDRGNALMVVKTISMLALAFVPYGLIISGVVTGWAALALCVPIGLGIAGVGFSICHDAIHGAYSRREGVNRVMGLLFEVMGGSVPLWHFSHNRVHHMFTNLNGMDEDVVVSPLIRLSPQSPRKPIHRFQQWFAFALYALGTINWIFAKDYVYFFRKRIGPFENKPTLKGFLALVAGKLVHYAWTIVIPLLVLPISFPAFLLGYLVMHFTAGFTLGIVFQLAHVVESTDHPVPSEGGRIADAWAVHQMRTTANFARKNPIVTWYTGGLNYQVEHHLFPRVCSIHYPHIAPIVEACAKRHGVPYNDQPSFLYAVRSHFRVLKRLGRYDDLNASPA